MAQPKTFTQSTGWEFRPNHAGSKVLVAPLTDASGITIPGMTMRLEVKAPVVVDACLLLYSLMWQSPHFAPRLYQLEICPNQKKSHMDATQVLFGPHEHLGDAVFGISENWINCSNWRGGLEWFLARCSITSVHPIPQP